MLEQMPTYQQTRITTGFNLRSENRLSVLYYELKNELACFGYKSFEEFQRYVNESDDPIQTLHEWQVHANRR